MKNLLNIFVIITIILLLFWQQNTPDRNIWVQLICFFALFYSIARLSSKIPSKKIEKEENEEDVKSRR